MDVQVGFDGSEAERLVESQSFFDAAPLSGAVAVAVASCKAEPMVMVAMATMASISVNPALEFPFLHTVMYAVPAC